VSLAGIVGRREARARKAAKSLGCPGFTDFRALTEDGSVDAIDVTVPSGVHRAPVVAALEAGKHVFCETPIALNLDDADAMIRAARRHGRLFLVAQLMRFSPEYARVRQAAASGELGRPVAAVASRVSPPYWSPKSPRPFPVYGEPLLELSIFDFNYLNWIFGRPVSVFTRGLRGTRNAADHYTVTLRYREGVGVVEGSARLPASHPFNTHLRVLFEHGMYEGDFRLHKGHMSFSLLRYPARGEVEHVRPPGGDPYRAECAYFVDCVRGRADPSLIEAVHDREALRVGLAARESFRTGRPVKL
jgi:predicted dehydrogenase